MKDTIFGISGGKFVDSIIERENLYGCKPHNYRAQKREKIAWDTLKVGAKCTVSHDGDVFMMSHIRKFVWSRCIFIKVTRAGLVQVAMENNQKLTTSVPKNNIVFIGET